MASIGTTEILIILAVVLLLFGSSKLPTLARSLGKSARILKAETKGLHDDEDGGQGGAAPQAQNQAQPQARNQAGAAAQGQEQEQPAGDGGQGPRGALGSGEPIQGVPVSDPGRREG